MTYTKEQVLAIIGEDDTKTGLQTIVAQNELREEQRTRLENMESKKTREVIQYC